MTKYILYLLLTLSLVLDLTSCDNVDDGYRENTNESAAQLTISLLTSNRGAIGDTVSFLIHASSAENIKSIVVTSEISGSGGSGFVVPDTCSTDPLVDHVYGTVQPGTKSFCLRYNYIVSEDTADSKLSFKLVDNSGEKTSSYTVNTIPAIVFYSNISLYALNTTNTDGFSTYNGTVYHNLASYEAISTTNETVQESLDIIFLVINDTAMLVAPYNGNFSSSMSVKNKTLFKTITSLSSSDFDKLTNASLSKITEDSYVKKGSTGLWNVRIGDIIGFRTDYASANDNKYGIIRINSIHPATVSYYSGTCYQMDVDIAVQK